MTYYTHFRVDLIKDDIVSATDLDKGTLYQASDTKDLYTTDGQGSAVKLLTELDSIPSIDDPSSNMAYAFSNLYPYIMTLNMNNFNEGDVDNITGWALTSASNREITGIQAPSDPSKFITRIIFNKSSGSDIKLKDNDINSSAGNRLYLPGGSDFIVKKYESIVLIYIPDLVSTGVGAWGLL